MHLAPGFRSRRGVVGLTLIELMIAITVAMVLLAAMAVMYGSSIKARNQIERSNRQIENGRHAIQLLRDDLQMAGFFGEFNMLDLGPTIPPAVPDFCVTHLTAQGDLPPDSITGSIAADLTGDGLINGLDYFAASLAIHVQGIDDVVPGTLPACLAGADVRAGTDVIALRRLLSCSTADANCGFQVGAPYMQASQCNTQINTPGPGNTYRLRADADVAAFNRRTATCTAGVLTPIRRFVTHIYFVANNNLPSDGIPTLKRRELVNTGFTTTALVEGIEDLQFEYGVDGVDAAGNPAPLDGSPDVYADLPANAWEWANTRTVRVHLLSRATEVRPGYTDTNAYTLGSKTVAAPADAFTRQVFQTVVQFHNANPAGRPPPPAPPLPPTP